MYGQMFTRPALFSLLNFPFRVICYITFCSETCVKRLYFPMDNVQYAPNGFEKHKLINQDGSSNQSNLPSVQAAGLLLSYKYLHGAPSTTPLLNIGYLPTILNGSTKAVTHRSARARLTINMFPTVFRCCSSMEIIQFM